jgi:hypothetical protein
MEREPGKDIADQLFDLRPARHESMFSDLVRGILSSPPVVAPPIQDRWFKDQQVSIDGYTFERCRFDRCQLVTNIATFSFKDCFIARDCELYLVGPALKVGRLLMHLLETKGRTTRMAGEEALYARINLDGTFSLE